LDVKALAIGNDATIEGTPLIAIAIAIAAAAMGLVSLSRADDPTATQPKVRTVGFDLAGRDTAAVTPGSELLPLCGWRLSEDAGDSPGPVGYGMFDALSQLSEDRVHDILEKARRRPGRDRRRGPHRRLLPRLYGRGPRQAPWARGLWRRCWPSIRAATKPLAAGGTDGAFVADLLRRLLRALDRRSDAKDPDHYASTCPRRGSVCPTATIISNPAFAAQKAAYQATSPRC